MERPKHRRFILPGLALLAGSVLLLGRQWFFDANEPAPAPIAEVELPAVEAASAVITRQLHFKEWGRVCEHFHISPEDLSEMLAQLGARKF